MEFPETSQGRAPEPRVWKAQFMPTVIDRGGGDSHPRLIL